MSEPVVYVGNEVCVPLRGLVARFERIEPSAPNEALSGVLPEGVTLGQLSLDGHDVLLIGTDADSLAIEDMMTALGKEIGEDQHATALVVRPGESIDAYRMTVALPSSSNPQDVEWFAERLYERTLGAALAEGDDDGKVIWVNFSDDAKAVFRKDARAFLDALREWPL